MWSVLFAITGCIGSLPTGPTGDDVEPPDDTETPPLAPVGLVTSPEHGDVVDGDTRNITLHVTGKYNLAGPLSVQALANPDDLASWTTIGMTTAKQGAFAVDVKPVQTQDRAAWPRGGVYRLRVVDGSGYVLPHDLADPSDTVIALANPGNEPGTWTYLLEKTPGSIAETQAYYTATNAPTTLDAFKQLYGFPGNESAALYYNRGDLRIGRDMHCRATTTPAGGVACYVANYGQFGGSRNQALQLAVAGGAPLATVAMVYTPPIDAPNAVTFIVYSGAGTLLNEAQLDTQGDNTSIPQNCINCHGGRSSYDMTTHAVSGARFLPFDPEAFDFSQAQGFTFTEQEADFRALNRLVATAAPTDATKQVIEGMFPLSNGPYDPQWVPAGWRTTPSDTRVYREAVAPYCRGCHVAFAKGANDPAAFATAASFRGYATSIVTKMCTEDPKGMPTAQATTRAFFDSPARALVLQWLGAPGACAPVQ